MTRIPRERRDDWDSTLRVLIEEGSQALWRTYCDALYRRLLDRWLGTEEVTSALKTDLYDEAVADGLAPRLADSARSVVGLDVSTSVVEAARRRHPWLQAVLADTRALPFAAACLDQALSNSTLDHFDDAADIERSLFELAMVLRPGGRLVVTLDNPWNPFVGLRNLLPLALLRRLGIVPYHVGATHGITTLRGLLAQCGFEVVETTAILHCPRVLMVPLARRLDRASPASRERFLRFLASCEALEGLPTRWISGHYVAALAVRR